MPRVHLFEFEDQTWFPAPVREAMTDFLSFMSGLADAPFKGFVERLNLAMLETGDDRLIDLASGAGGPAITIARLLRAKRDAKVTVTLTDLYPNLPRLELARREGQGFVDFIEEPVDARSVRDPVRVRLGTKRASSCRTSSADDGRSSGDFSSSSSSRPSIPLGSTRRTGSGNGGGASVHCMFRSSRGAADSNGGRPLKSS